VFKQVGRSRGSVVAPGEHRVGPQPW